jgi:RNA polymerase sigma-70 factor (ECF subfamily)
MTDKQSSDPSTWLEDYGDYLFRYALMRVGDQASAEDLVQETLLAGLKGRDKFDGRVDVKYWLRGILKHKVVDYIRKASRDTPVEDPEMVQMANSTAFQWLGFPGNKPEPWHFNPRRAFEQKEFWDVFSGCLEGLRGPMRAAFTLRELDGVSTEEICKALDVSTNNVWVILHRARAQLRDCLQQNWLNKTEEPEP